MAAFRTLIRFLLELKTPVDNSDPVQLDSGENLEQSQSRTPSCCTHLLANLSSNCKRHGKLWKLLHRVYDLWLMRDKEESIWGCTRTVNATC